MRRALLAHVLNNTGSFYLTQDWNLKKEACQVLFPHFWVWLIKPGQVMWQFDTKLTFWNILIYKGLKVKLEFLFWLFLESRWKNK